MSQMAFSAANLSTVMPCALAILDSESPASTVTVRTLLAAAMVVVGGAMVGGAMVVGGAVVVA